jgi:translation initiation factor IF-2
VASTYHLSRTPIVAVMGHVDHGKTTLLDSICGKDITSSEAGGITQNTRVHQIPFEGQKITFIDTPGHEAFSSMRSRGAQVTDIVLLVVAADDGVQPQTKESIKFAKESNVPIVVAINKTDIPGKNLTKIKQELTSAGLNLEEYGGETMVVEVSALKKTNIDELLNRILLLAEISELKMDSVENVLGRVFTLEASLDSNRGPVAMCIVKAGEVNAGDYLAYKGGTCKIRSMLNTEQKEITKAVQGDPIWLVGANKVFSTGEMVDIAKDEKAAKQLAKQKEDDSTIAEVLDLAQEAVDDLDLLSSMLDSSEQDKQIKFLNVILKTDTQGTLEAVKAQLLELNDEEVQIKILKEGTGKIQEDDILTAKNSKGLVIGFQVQMDKHVEDVARKEKVLVRIYEIIYDLTQELSEAMDSMMDPKYGETETARALIKRVFILSNGLSVAGCSVEKGNITRGSKVYVLRNEERMGDGRITQLKILKKEVKEAKKGVECGIMIEPAIALEEGDEIVCFKVEKI